MLAHTIDFVYDVTISIQINKILVFSVYILARTKYNTFPARSAQPQPYVRYLYPECSSLVDRMASGKCKSSDRPDGDKHRGKYTLQIGVVHVHFRTMVRPQSIKNGYNIGS